MNSTAVRRAYPYKFPDCGLQNQHDLAENYIRGDIPLSLVTNGVTDMVRLAAYSFDNSIDTSFVIR